MSLKSGLQSISGGADRAAARRVNRGSTPDRCVLEEDDDGSSSSDNEGKDGDVLDDLVSTFVGLSLSVATTAADVSVHGAKDGPDSQDGGDLERQGKNLLVVVSVLLVDGSKQSSSRCGSDQSDIDGTYAADSCDLVCTSMNPDVVIDKGSDSAKVKIVEMQDLHLDGNVTSPESSKVAKAIDAESFNAEVCNNISISLCVKACCNGPGVELALKDYTLKRTHAEYDVVMTVRMCKSDVAGSVITTSFYT
jgi:hypothetical protein